MPDRGRRRRASRTCSRARGRRSRAGVGAAVARPRGAREPVQREPLDPLGESARRRSRAHRPRTSSCSSWRGTRRRSRLPCAPIRRPRHAAPIACAASSTHGDPVAVAEGVDGVDVERVAGEVDRHQRARPRGRSARSASARSISPVAGSESTSTGRRAEVHDRVGAGDEGERRERAPRRRADPEHAQRRASSPAVHEFRQRTNGDAEVVREPVLEHRDLRAGGQPAAADRVEQLVDLVVADVRRAHAEERSRGSPWLAVPSRQSRSLVRKVRPAREVRASPVTQPDAVLEVA